MKNEGRRNRPWLLLFSLTTIILTFITLLILSSFIIFSPPNFQLQSISISFHDSSLSDWRIAFSFANPNFPTMRYRGIRASVGGRRPRSSTVADVDHHFPFKQGFHGRNFWNATVYVALPAPRPRLRVDGIDFDVRFVTEYEIPPGRRWTAVVACGDKGVGFSTAGGEVVMVGGPAPCKVVSRTNV